MKNTFKLFAIIAITAVIVFSTGACKLDPGDDGVAKTLVITGIPETDGGVTLLGKQITVAICDNSKKGDPKIVALNQATSAASVTIPLLSGNEHKKGGSFTGTGDFYIFLFFDVSNTPGNLSDDTAYIYGGGGNNPYPYNISKGAATSTLEFSKFYKTND